MKNTMFLAAILALCAAASATAQNFDSEPVFGVQVLPDRSPVVAGEELQLAVVVSVDRGWHVNSDQPGDEFSLPTTVELGLPDGWPLPEISFPDGELLEFDFADGAIEVWEERVVIVAKLVVPPDALGETRLRARVTAQACNNTQCLPPATVAGGVDVTVVEPGSEWNSANAEFFAASSAGDSGEDGAVASELESKSLPLLLIGVFFAGLALNLTPCVFPLIPITIGFFTQQTKDRQGSTFPLALAYVVGIAATYSVLGVLAALSGAIFGSALQNPWVVGLIVVVLLALATSMFGLWELRVPGWAQRASGGRSGLLGALIMGLVMGFVAAPCIGPFVVGLLTYVGQRGDPVLGFLLFFTLASGLGLPYLILGTFTGAVNKLPASGMWMVGVRRVFGVILVAMAAYFLVIDRTGHEQAAIDRVMRVLAAGMLVLGVVLAPGVRNHGAANSDEATGHLVWQTYEGEEVAAAISRGGPVIIDFYADWCAPCRELDEKTFAAPGVRSVLEGFSRFKVDLTRSDETNQQLTAEYEVLGVPTVIVFRDGLEAFRITGFEPPERFLKRLVGDG
ncbi:MAG: cytochrome c biogenesis protein CcdA [Acidobacteriota bacterium]